MKWLKDLLYNKKSSWKEKPAVHKVLICELCFGKLYLNFPPSDRRYGQCKECGVTGVGISINPEMLVTRR